MFYSIKKLVEQADLDFQRMSQEYWLQQNMNDDRERARSAPPMALERSWKPLCELGLSEKQIPQWANGWRCSQTRSPSQSGKALSDFTIPYPAAWNAIAVQRRHNAKMEPRSAPLQPGSAGCRLPKKVSACSYSKLDLMHEEQLDFLFAAWSGARKTNQR